MSTTRPLTTGMTRGRVDVTERSLAEVREFVADAHNDVHIERRGSVTYLVTDE